MSYGSDFPPELSDGLWHTTSPHHYQGIVRIGFILPNPPSPDSERWKTAGGSKYYPYVRVLGGVSLFDFTDFDPDQYGEKYPISTWRSFVPYQDRWKAAVWLKVEVTMLGDAYIAAPELLARWKQDEAWRHTIMPLIEAAHIGPVPLSAVSRALRVDSDDPTFREIPVS
jgi:hypothetical protein